MAFRIINIFWFQLIVYTITNFFIHTAASLMHPIHWDKAWSIYISIKIIASVILRTWTSGYRSFRVNQWRKLPQAYNQAAPVYTSDAHHAAPRPPGQENEWMNEHVSEHVINFLYIIHFVFTIHSHNNVLTEQPHPDQKGRRQRWLRLQPLLDAHHATHDHPARTVLLHIDVG